MVCYRAQRGIIANVLVIRLKCAEHAHRKNYQERDKILVDRLRTRIVHLRENDYEELRLERAREREERAKRRAEQVKRRARKF